MRKNYGDPDVKWLLQPEEVALFRGKNAEGGGEPARQFYNNAETRRLRELAKRLGLSDGKIARQVRARLWLRPFLVAAHQVGASAVELETLADGRVAVSFHTRKRGPKTEARTVCLRVAFPGVACEIDGGPSPRQKELVQQLRDVARGVANGISGRKAERAGAPNLAPVLAAQAL